MESLDKKHELRSVADPICTRASELTSRYIIKSVKYIVDRGEKQGVKKIPHSLLFFLF